MTQLARRAPLAALCALALSACAVGKGEGDVKSDRLYMEGCWEGKFDLHPDFFAANPYLDQSLLIRVQRGDDIEEQSDGIIVLVNDLQELRSQLADSATGELSVKIGMPPGVSPPGVPLTLNPDPPKVSISLYLHNTCHAQNATIYSLSGNIVFRSLFSGDPGESRASARLTDASFEGVFADPRQLGSDDQKNGEFQSNVVGDFRFYFQRGQPAQPFQ